MPAHRTMLPPLCLLLAAGAAPLAAQTPAPVPPAPTITVQSQLVLVPTEVRTRHGETIFGLHASDFILTADGVPQRLRLDESATPMPLSLVVLVQCSRDAWREGPKIRGLGTMIDAILGASPARVAVVDFGAELELLTGLTDDSNRRDAAFRQLGPCPDDTGAGIYDALAYANHLLDRDHANGRRLILMISETRDHGSKLQPAAVIEALNRSNTMVDAVAFSPGRDALTEDLKSADGASGSVFGLVAMAVQALRKNAPKELARETGGEYINFASQNGFDRDLNSLANRVHNAYELSFVPHLPPLTGADDTADTLHTLRVEVPRYPDARITHRANYWATAASSPAGKTGP